MTKTMVEFLKEEASRFNNVVYFSKPYSCCIDEALGHFRNWDMPKPERLTIERTDKDTKISIKPIKGSGLRKPYVIRLWIS